MLLTRIADQIDSERGEWIGTKLIVCITKRNISSRLGNFLEKKQP